MVVAIMRLIIPSEELSLAISRVQSTVTEKKLAYLSLKAITHETTGGSLKVASTDASLDIYSEHLCSVQQAGECHVIAKVFVEHIRQLPKGNVGLSVEDKDLALRMQEQSHYVELKVPLIQEYFWIAEQELPHVVRCEIGSAQLSYMISQVAFTLGHDPAVPYAEYGYLEQPIPQVLRLVGTDTVRLSYADTAVVAPADFLSRGICLSKKALGAMLRVCEQGAPTIEMMISADQTVCRLKISGYDVYVRTNHAAYPDCRKLIPKHISEPIVLDKENLIGMIKRTLLSTDRSNTIRLSFAANTFTLSAKNDGGSQGKETISLSYDRPPLVFGLNGEFFLNILSHILSSHVALSIKDENSYLVIYGASEPGDCLSRHVIAPIVDTMK